jgi:hypothetical protein
MLCIISVVASSLVVDHLLDTVILTYPPVQGLEDIIPLKNRRGPQKGMFRTEERVALQRRAIGGGTVDFDEAAQGIGREHAGPTAGGLTNQHATQQIVVGVALVDARTGIEVLFQAKGIHRHGRDPSTGRAAQHPFATGVVDVLFLAVGACVIRGQVVESVIGEGGCRAINVAAGDVAPGIVEARIGLACLGATGRAQDVEPSQPVRVTAVTVEILRGGAARTLRGLPQLS